MTPLPRRLRRQIVNAPEPTPPPELAERLARKAADIVNPKMDCRPSKYLQRWNDTYKNLLPLFRKAVKGNKRLRTAARVAAEKMEEVETFGEGNPWSEAIYESLDAEVRG